MRAWLARPQGLLNELSLQAQRLKGLLDEFHGGAQAVSQAPALSNASHEKYQLT